MLKFLLPRSAYEIEFSHGICVYKLLVRNWIQKQGLLVDCLFVVYMLQ